MATIRVVESGILNRDDSVYPTVVRIAGNELLAALALGGQDPTGGTHWARSSDTGRTWTYGGQILLPGRDPLATNSLRLSQTAGGGILAYGFRKYPSGGSSAFGHMLRREPVFCRSDDGGHTWSPAEVIPTPIPGPWEVSNPIVVLADGRWLAPAATLSSADRLGETVVAFASADNGQSWPEMYQVMRDPLGRCGYFEQKLIELEPGRLLAAAWTVRFPDYADQENHFALSSDGGRTWTPPTPAGLHGQTLTPIWLGGDRLLAIYNRRQCRPGVRAALVRFSDREWSIACDEEVWSAVDDSVVQSGASGIDRFPSFAFGLPSGMVLEPGTVLAVYWVKQAGVCSTRWARLQVTF